VTALGAATTSVRGLDEPGHFGRPLWEYVGSTGLRVVVMGASKDPNAKVTLVLVSEESGLPSLVVKAPTSDGAGDAIEAEARVLAELELRPAGTVARTIPRVIERLALEGRPAVVMTALQGVPMTTAYLEPRHTRGPARVSHDFAAVEKWLAGFQAGTAREPAPLDMLDGVAGRLRERFAEDARLEADLDRLADIDLRLRRNVVRRTAVHGDLWFGNILLAQGRVTGVVDWEAGRVSGAPTRDIVRFAHMYALYLDLRTRPGRRVAGHPGLRAGAWGAGVEYALEGTGWFPDLYRRFLSDGLARLGVVRESWHDAALAGIAEVAAFTDDPEFACRHLDLFRRLAGGTTRKGPE